MSKKKSLLAKKVETAIAKINTVQFTVPARIDTDKDYEQGRGLYKAISNRLKEVQARQAAILDPLKASTNEVKSLFKPVIDSLTDTADELKKVLGEFATRREKERQEELERINNDKRLKNPETIQKLRNEVADKPEGTMRIQKLVITNISLIPVEYWTVDEVALRKALLQGTKIPGAKLVTELTVINK